MQFRLWIDDVRPEPKGWTRMYTVADFERFVYDAIRFGYFDTISVMSFDHDAGDYASEGGDYIECLNWLEETVVRHSENGEPLTLPKMEVHSMNPVGRQKMERIIERIQNYA